MKIKELSKEIESISNKLSEIYKLQEYYNDDPARANHAENEADLSKPLPDLLAYVEYVLTRDGNRLKKIMDETEIEVDI
jgi:hypothetical protein